MSFWNKEIMFGEPKKKTIEDPFSNGALLQEILEKKQRQLDILRPEPADFKDHKAYDHADIEADIARASELESQWALKNNAEEKKVKDVSDALEFAVFKNIKAWSGGGLSAIPVARIDDYERGTDLVFQVHRPDTEHSLLAKGMPNYLAEYLGLSIDVTFGGEADIKRKLESIRNQIRSNKPTRLKYFRSAGYRGPLTVTRGILPVSPKTAKELIVLEAGERTEELADHKFRHLMMYQLQAQYLGFYEYATRRESLRIAGMYKDAYNGIWEVLRPAFEEFKEDPEIIEYLENDPGLVAINRYFEELNGQSIDNN